MEFSEKLSALLTLTATKNAELAEALRLGQPYVSRLKTGQRRIPSDPRVIRGMADFFARRCEDDYHRSALRECTSDPRLNAFASRVTVTDVLFDWLSGADRPAKNPVGQFLNRFDTFSLGPGPIDPGVQVGRPTQAQGVSLYYGNEGKRQALRDMIAYVDSLEEPCTIRLFTDEIYDWLIEDDAFIRWLNEKLSQQIARGVTFERIQPPFNSSEYNFSAIERWMSGYMAGAVQQYYYPWSRDKLHRRTLFIIPGQIAFSASSVFGDHEALLTMLSREPGIVDLGNREYDAILRRCRPAMSTFTSCSERLFTESEAAAAIEDEGIYKTCFLSVNTLPPEIIGRLRQHGTPFARRMCDSFERRAQARATVLLQNPITDIMCLPKLSNVLVGREPIPGTQSLPEGPAYYTPAEYRAHLERILWHLDVFPNYRAVFTDEPENSNVILYVKGDSRALLIKQSPPFAVFNITESSMAAAFCDYLRNLADKYSDVGTRRDTVARLKREIEQLSAFLA